MHPVRKQRLILVLVVVAVSSVVSALVLYATREFGDYAYSISKIVSGDIDKTKSIRAGGCVVPGSVIRATDRLFTTFQITDGMANLKVTYDGLLPDLFAEEEAAVITGRLDDGGTLVASKVMAKHDETYTPKEVSDNLEEANVPSRDCKGITYE